MKKRRCLHHSLLLVVAILGCFAKPEAAPAATTVVWVSVDGLRADYLDRAATPFFDFLATNGAHTRRLAPTFPSLTFPSHVSQATGAPVTTHGVPGNSFIDSADWDVYRYPWDSTLLQAEPIWLTAARQGVRAAVCDWPLSHAQRGEIRAEYFGPRFIPTLSDRERVDALIDAWKHDLEQRASEPPLRLLMGYIVGPDAAGHQFGPDTPKPLKKTAEADALLRYLYDESLALWERRQREGDDFIFMVTTDHGMSPVHTLVNMKLLSGDASDDVLTLELGSIAHVFLKKQGNEKKLAKMRARIERHSFARAYTRDALPPKWGYGHPTRVGDLVVVLEPGYAFSHRAGAVTADASEAGGPLGMHGYDVGGNPDMHGAMLIWRASRSWNGADLGDVDALQLHATVANLLGIDPSPVARQDAIALPE